MSINHNNRYQGYDEFYLQGKKTDSKRYKKYQRDCDKKFGSLLQGSLQRCVLDVGCASGLLTAYLKDKGFAEVVGIDLNDKLIEQARSRVDAEFACGDALPFLKSPRRFDIIFLLNILEHIERDQLVEFMTAVQNALNPDGFAVVRTPNMNHILSAGHLAEDLTHCTGLTEQSLGQLARLAGFREVILLNQLRWQNFKGKFKAAYSWFLHKWLWWIRGGTKPTVIYRNLYAQLIK